VTGRVHWDEKAIEEHNKERGTRQKIDEPDTPFVRSPQAASDSEVGPASSDDDHRLSFRSSPMGPMAPTQLPEQGGQQTDMDPLALASRLDDWVRSGVRRTSVASSSAASSDGAEYAADVDGADAVDNEISRLSSACSSRSSSSAPVGRRPLTDASVLVQRARASRGSREDRRISLSEDSIKPSKPSSASFKAKRAHHYNEVAALRAFRNGDVSSPESSGTSEEDDPTTTNTNTNINQTYTGPVEARLWRDKGDAQATAEASAGSAVVEPGAASAEVAAGVCKDRVSFSGESGGESSEEFRSRRSSHYSNEWRHDPTVSATVSSLQTNTNTNLNAGHSTSSGSSQTGAKNPMEAARPPVQFGQDMLETTAPPSEEFRARRQEHYDEARALRGFREEAGGEDASASDEEAAEEGGRHSAEPANPANPMEPRATGVAFQVSTGTGEIAVAEGSGSHEGHGDPSTAANAAVWKARRQAHYSEMAAALRSMPPPSDEEDSASASAA